MLNSMAIGPRGVCMTRSISAAWRGPNTATTGACFRLLGIRFSMFRAKNIRLNLKKILRLHGYMYEQVVVILH